MRILLLTQWFDPEPTFKGLLFARELQRRGHDVQILTGFPNYPGGNLYDGYHVRPVQRETISGITVVRVALYPSHNGSALHRIMNYGTFAVSAALAGLVVRRPDVVYVYHPPATVGLPALVLKMLRGVPFVYDVQDLWPDTLRATGMLSNSTVLRVVDGWMRIIYRAASHVVVLSDGFRDAVNARGVPLEKITVIQNWADEDRIHIDGPSAVNIAVAEPSDRFRVVFAGAMGPAQALTTVVDAAEILRAATNIEFLLIGGGIEVDHLKAEVYRRGLTNVAFMPNRPIDEIGEVLASADALLVHLKDEPLFDITVPSKTQVYLMAGRPILMGVRGDAADLVRKARAGLTFEPQSPTQLAQAVLELEAMAPGERARLGRNGQTFYRDELSLEVGSGKFIEVFDRARLDRPLMDAAKRLVDVVLGTCALLVLGVPMALLAVLIRINLGSPVIFRQSRPGRHGEPFDIFKFRTMTDARDARGKLRSDGERTTSFGAKLRATSLDELPELWNVVLGQMSLVGPRPLLSRYNGFFTAEERIRFLMRPGITGWAQVNGRNDATWDDRLRMDAWYVRNRSARGDIRILAMTVARVFRRSGVVVDPRSAMRDLDEERADQESVE